MSQRNSGNTRAARRRVAALGIALAIVAGLAALSVAPVSASTACTGPTKSYFAGAQKDTYDTTVFGVRANIEYQNPSLCGTSDIASAWAMLIPKTPLVQQAQAGYVKIGTSSGGINGQTGIHTFGQYTRACVPNCAAGVNGYPTFLGPAPGGTKMYSVYLRASDGRIGMYAGSTLLGVVNRSVVGEWDPAWSGQFAGETHNSGSDVPGTATNHVSFNYLQKYDSAGNINFIQNITAGVYPTLTKYHNTISPASVGGYALDIWTH